MCLSSPQYKQRLFTRQHCFSCSVNGLNNVFSICMGLSLRANTICLGCNMLSMVPNVSLITVQKVDYHHTQLAQLLNPRLWDQAWSIEGPSHLHEVQTEISS